MVESALIATEVIDAYFGTSFSLVADSVDIGSDVVGYKLRGTKNFTKATNYIETVVNDFKNKKRNELVNDINVQQNYIMKFLKNTIVIGE